MNDYQPNHITDCIIETGLALEKGILILGDLASNFPYDGNQSDYIQKWTWECERITTLIDIALDYMVEASEKVERAKELAKAQAEVQKKSA